MNPEDRSVAPEQAAIVLVCNGPGELATWVRPLAQRLHSDMPLRPLQIGRAHV